MSGFGRIVNPSSSIGYSAPVVMSGLTVRDGRPTIRNRVVSGPSRSQRPSLAEAISETQRENPRTAGLRNQADQLEQEQRIARANIWKKQRLLGQTPEQMSVQERKNILENQRAAIAHQQSQTKNLDLTSQAGAGLTRANTRGVDLDNQGKEFQLEQIKAQTEEQQQYRKQFMDMAKLSNSLKMIAPNKQGFHRLPGEVLNTIQSVLPDFRPERINPQTGRTERINAFGVVEPNDPEDPNSPKVFSLYQDDGSTGPPQRVMNKGAPVRIPVETIGEFAKLGEKFMGQTDANKSKEKQPAQVQLTEWIAENLTGGDKSKAWQMAQEGKSKPQELAAKLFLAEKKNLAKQFEYSPEDMPGDDEIMRSVQSAMSAMNIGGSAGDISQSPQSAGLTREQSDAQAEKEIRHSMGWRDYIPFVEPDPKDIRMRSNEIQGNVGLTMQQAAPVRQQADPLIDKAMSAIQRGADPAAVRQRLIERGYNEQQLRQAGL